MGLIIYLIQNAPKKKIHEDETLDAGGEGGLTEINVAFDYFGGALQNPLSQR